MVALLPIPYFPTIDWLNQLYLLCVSFLCRIKTSWLCKTLVSSTSEDPSSTFVTRSSKSSPTVLARNKMPDARQATRRTRHPASDKTHEAPGKRQDTRGTRQAARRMRHPASEPPPPTRRHSHMVPIVSVFLSPVLPVLQRIVLKIIFKI